MVPDTGTNRELGGRRRRYGRCWGRSPESNARAWERAAAIASPLWPMLRGLPGKLTISVRPRVPATPRDSIQCSLWGREEARIASDLFQHNALHDPLTGLPNRLLLQERLEHAAQRAKRSHSNAALLFADIDRFKLINDTYGHQAGDELLVAVAQRLAGLVRSGRDVGQRHGELEEGIGDPLDLGGFLPR